MDGFVYALDGKHGSFLSKYDMRSGFGCASPAIAPGILVVTSCMRTALFYRPSEQWPTLALASDAAATNPHIEKREKEAANIEHYIPVSAADDEVPLSFPRIETS